MRVFYIFSPLNSIILEHLSYAKQNAAFAVATEYSLDAIILVETWMTAARVPPQPKTDG